ncbi:PHD finger protein rhinoceros-like [Schistocerca serialis cubense]|uniref:PHD finger protein rhinoceros-like n=1 Tax=Schistocerca serialis cubense TaxID=2023355 RepID=UPI00214E3EA4|nr:PHD finger protein rhinoceros-like [Schistocerca serialis cubense]
MLLLFGELDGSCKKNVAETFRSAWRRLLGVRTPAGGAQSAEAGQEVTFVSPTRGCSHSGLGAAGVGATTTLLAVSAAASSTLLLHQDALAQHHLLLHQQKAAAAATAASGLPLPPQLAAASQVHARGESSKVSSEATAGAADKSRSGGQSSSNRSTSSSGSSNADTLLLAPGCSVHSLQEGPPSKAKRPTVKRKWSAAVIFEKGTASKGPSDASTDAPPPPPSPADSRANASDQSASPTHSKESTTRVTSIGNNPLQGARSSRNDESGSGRLQKCPSLVTEDADHEQAQTGASPSKTASDNEAKDCSPSSPSRGCSECDSKGLQLPLGQNVDLFRSALECSDNPSSEAVDSVEGTPSAANVPEERRCRDRLASNSSATDTPKKASNSEEEPDDGGQRGGAADGLSGRTVLELTGYQGGSTWSLRGPSEGGGSPAEPAVSALVLSASRCASRAVLAAASFRDNNNSRDVPSRYTPDKDLQKGDSADAVTAFVGALRHRDAVAPVSEAEAIELQEMVVSAKQE